jgi:chromosome segregation protein
MTAPARLLALRLQGFKSFGERTLVEFGPGISAVVGPNGSGKSNLADALRWALGEQGRALRLRKSEDVIFAGSERRSALGMADVTLVLDNADRLLPIDFETVELGRRLFRSGESDYLLNRQRVRLRDLVDLLDSAHLADNAFLFIGQGMVDQALALRPEERRPLFEEVAGVRRHERRKRKAEEQLEEAEANLARVEDVLAELRPQARRLAAQAEQQASRQNAGREYGRAVVAMARSRWFETAARLGEASRGLRTGQSESDAALAALREAEDRAAEIARELASRSDTESERLAAHEAVRGLLTELQLRDARLVSEAEAAARDRERLAAERAAVEADLEHQRRDLAAPVAAPDLALAAAVAEAERALAEALEELGAMRATSQVRDEEAAALRRVQAARAAELETARRRLVEAGRVAEAEAAASDEAARRLAEAEGGHAGPRDALVASTEREKEAGAGREAARAELDRREGARAATAEAAAALAARAAGLRGRHSALAARLAEEEARAIARAARKLGGSPIADGLQVESGFRVAVEAALGEAVRGYVVEREAALGLESQRGTLVLNAGGPGSGSSASRAAGRGAARAAEREAEAASPAVEAALGHGGGRLAEAVRADPTGAVGRLLSRALWVPDLKAGLAVQPHLPQGWIVVTKEGAVATADGVVAVGRRESQLERRVELERVGDEAGRLEKEAGVAAEAARKATEEVEAGRRALDQALEEERQATAARREAEERERLGARAVETAAREAAWRAAQAERAGTERERLAAAAEAAETAARGDAGETLEGDTGDQEGEPGAMREWETRAAALRARRDQLAAEEAGLEAARREAEARQARAGAAAEMDQRRLAELDRQAAELAAREATLAADREGLGESLAGTGIREAAVRGELEEIRCAEAALRGQLSEAETTAGKARERMRVCQERIRYAEVAELEARMALDSIREQVLVELAGLGDLGLRLLSNEGELDDEAQGDERRTETEDSEGDDDEYALALEEALTSAGARWAAGPQIEPPPTSRLATLRRRFHELGAPNPFAAEEHQALKTRLDGLEAQRADLIEAISKTRAVIEQLNAMIATQFRTTFAALETAFDSRFRQLFDGGYARLSLTDPEDLAATGVEIVARPPGKKAQPLSMLSGGERALTAVALLFAMLEIHPVPFCVLDEVDAALDEANIGRFVDALRGLADQTQFIVITHNRGTIETADALYGVTVGEDAISRVISLRLEEAREVADQVARSKASSAG